MVVARRRSALRAAGPDLEVGEVEILRPQKVSLDLQAGVVRHHFLLQGLEDDAEALELALVALELAPDRLAGLLVSPHPGGLVVLHLAQDLLSRHSIVVIQQERDEVEPALGLGHAPPSSRSRSISFTIAHVSILQYSRRSTRSAARSSGVIESPLSRSRYSSALAHLPSLIASPR